MKRYLLVLAILSSAAIGGWLWHHRSVFPEGHRGKYPLLILGDQEGQLKVEIGMDVRSGIREKKIAGHGTLGSRTVTVRIIDVGDRNFTLLWEGDYQFTGHQTMRLNQEMIIGYDSGSVSMDLDGSLRIGARMVPYE